MSLVTVLVIEHQCLRVARVHWREVKNAIGTAENQSGVWLDAGYVLVDKDSGVFVNAQNAVLLSQKDAFVN